MRRVLQIDIETYSDVDLLKCGVYRYVESPEFEILLFGYAYDDDPIRVIDLTKDKLPDEILKDLQDSAVLKTAFNANFERTCIAMHFNVDCDPSAWRCTMVWAWYMGLSGGLDQVAKILKLEAEKDAKGKNLIKYFSVPCKPTKINGGRTRNHPQHDPEKWRQFVDYCRQDVHVEREIRRKLAKFEMPDKEWALWALDQEINDRGVRLDPKLIKQAIRNDTRQKERLIQQAKDLTGLENPNSNTQLRQWLEENGLETPDGIGKEQMEILLDEAPSEEVRLMLGIRRELGKTSVDKFQAMERYYCQDGRAHGLLQFYGANRTGRWAGRGVQVQNLPQNKMGDLAEARATLRSGDLDWFETMYAPTSFTLSQLIRTAFIPEEGHHFIVADFSAIEARVIAWLADEKWVLEVFRGHGKIYEATAAQMFKVPIDTIVKGHPNYELRAKGKVAVLACGYQGGVGALIAMGALKGGIPEEELPKLVNQWREANPRIKRLWYEAEKAAIRAIQNKTTVKLAHGVQYRYRAGILFADLPSGRSLAYLNARLKPDPNFDKMGIVFDGMDQVKKQWGPQRTYGGKLVENLVQAIARDCLAESMMGLKDNRIVMHVHDEIIIEEPIDGATIEAIVKIMSEPVPWAPGLPLTAAGYACEFYQKD